MKLDTVTVAAAGANATPAAPQAGTRPAPAAAPFVAGVEQQQAQVSAEAAIQAAAEINKFLQSTSANVEFTVDAGSNHIIVRVVDSETNRLIRQIPSEETLAISQALDRMSGLLFAQKA